MSDPRRRDAFVLAVAAVAAIALPALAGAHLDRRIDTGLEPALSDALGEPVHVGGIQVGATGSLRLTDVRVGDLASAAELEASASAAALAQGRLRADQIRVRAPRIAARLGPDGRLDLERVLERAATRIARGPGAGDREGRAPRLRRIMVTGGELALDLGPHGTVAVHDLELHPQRGGVRAVAGRIDVDVRAGRVRARGHLARAGADLVLPRGRFERMLAIGGRLAVAAGGRAPATFDRVRLALGVHERPGMRFEGETPDGGRLVLRAERSGSITARAQALPLSPFSGALPRALDTGRGHLDGHLELGRRKDGSTTIESDLELRDVTIDDRRLARAPVTVDLGGRVRAVLAGDELTVERARLRLGAIEVRGDGRVWLGEHPWLPARGEARLRLTRTACASALDAVPEPLRRALAGMELSGQLSGRAELAFDRADPRATRLDVDLGGWNCTARAEADAADPRQLRGAFERTVAGGERVLLDADAEGYTPLDGLPRYLPGGFVAAEDARFFDHRGFDLHQIERSIATDLAAGAFVRGGSTISQQLVKNAFLSHERSIARKLQEALLTWRLEAYLDKRLILERYLNLIELGDGVRGVAAAARHWFGKAARDLDVREAAFLVALTPAPRTISARIAESAGIDWHTARQVDQILDLMRRAGVIGPRAHRRALDDRLALRPGVLAAAVD